MERYITIKEQEYQISVNYNLGGYNYFSGKTQERGYYLHIQPVTRKHFDNGTSITCNPMDGAKTLIRVVKRKSDKQYRLAVQEAEALIPWLFSQMGIDYQVQSEAI